MAKPEVGAVTVRIITNMGKTITAGAELYTDRKGRPRVRQLYRGLPQSTPGYMNRLKYPTEIPVIANGCMLLRKKFAIEMLDRGMDLFSMDDWIKMSIHMREEGYVLINEPRVFAIWKEEKSCKHNRSML
jgi:hypothetical protein